MNKELENVIEEISAKRGDDGKLIYRRFNKRNFNKLVNAMANDPNLISNIVKIKKGVIAEEIELEVGKELRKWIKKIVEGAGIDPTESSFVMGEGFEVPSMNWLYDFVAEVLYVYMKAGNKFDLPPREDFAGSIYLKEIAKVEKVTTVMNPQTNSITGKAKTVKEAHDELKVRSVCPKYKQTKEMI